MNDGFEAIEAAKLGGFDLILLDVRMPRTTGYDACRQIRKLTVTKDTPIIFLSAKGQESEVEAGLQAGADEYILKPFTPNDLIERINFYLSKSAN